MIKKRITVFDFDGTLFLETDPATISNYEFDRPVLKPVLHPGETFQRTLKAGNPPETTTVKCTWDDGTGSKSKDYNIELFPF